MKRIALSVFVVAVTSLCSGQWLERQVVIGDTFGDITFAGGLVVNPISGNVYIESDPIRLFNPRTLQKLSAPGATGPVIFCPPSGKGYVVGESLVILSAVKDKVIGSAALPFAPGSYAYSRTSNRLYLAQWRDSSLLVFDPDGDSILETITVGFRIDALQWDTVWNRLYIGGSSDTAVELLPLDCAGDTLLPGIRTSLRELQSFALSTVSHKLYCVGLDSNDMGTVAVISTDSLSLVDTVPGVPSDVMTYNVVTDRLYAFDGTVVNVYDCRSDTLRTVRDVGQEISAITVSSLTGRVYLGSHDTAQVMVMDTNDSIVGWISPPSTEYDEIDGLTFSSGHNQLYGVTYGEKAFVVDASADTVAGSVSYVPPLTATQMIHNPAGNKLYAFCPGSDPLVFDSTFLTPKHIIGGVTGTHAVPVLNQALNRLCVADANRLLVIDCNSDSLVVSKPTAGTGRPLPVMVPYLNRLYVFPGTGSSRDTVFAYDALRDTVSRVFTLSNDVPCAVYDQRSNRIFFACQAAPTILVLDPATNHVVKTLGLGGGSNNGRMALNPDLGHLYYTDQGSRRMYTIDVLAESVIASESLPWKIDAMFLDQRLGKLFMCSGDSAKVLVFNCGQGKIVDTIDAAFRYAGLMDDRNDKLYLRYGAVADCRYDSVVTLLPPGSQTPSSMAWDAIDNRVFEATTSRIYVYRDNLTGVEESTLVDLRPMLTVLGNPARGAVRLRLQVPRGQMGTLTLYDVAGRVVHSLSVIRTATLSLDLHSIPTGVYFVSLETGGTRLTDKVIVQH